MLWGNEDGDRSRENLTATTSCAVHSRQGNLANYAVFDQGIFDTFFSTTDDGRAIFEERGGRRQDRDAVQAEAASGGCRCVRPRCRRPGEDSRSAGNELAKKGNDDDFGKAGREDGRHRERAVLPGQAWGYSFFFERWGIATDKQRRVLDVDSKPIPNLYAIGNDGNMLYRRVHHQHARHRVRQPGELGPRGSNNVAEFPGRRKSTLSQSWGAEFSLLAVVPA